MALAAHALTDYATVAAELGLSGSTDQAMVERFINVASKLLATFCNRQLQFQAGFVESFAGFGRPIARLQLAPLVAIASVTIDGGEALGSTDYSIDDADAGTLYRESGWISTAQLRTDLNFQRRPMPGTEEKLNVATYAGGWITSPQAYSAAGYPGAVQTLAIGTLFKTATDLWMALPATAGTAPVTGGSQPSFPSAPPVGTKQLDGSVSWVYLGTTGAAGARGTAATLPEDLEQACVITAKAYYRSRRRDPLVKSESVLGASQTWFEPGQLPSAAEAIAKQYERVY